MATEFQHFVQSATDGKPYVLVIMSYNDDFSVFIQIERWIREEFGLDCIRADQVIPPGNDLLNRLHALIKNAELVVADISHKRDNVLYELGYAVAIEKDVLVLAEKATELPANLQGLVVRRYPHCGQRFPGSNGAIRGNDRA